MATDDNNNNSVTFGGQQQRDNEQQQQQNGGEQLTRYEKIMGKQKEVGDDGNSIITADVPATEALSARLATFRTWLSEEADVQLHSALCIVNGEATDGTRNAPVLLFEKPAGGADNHHTTIIGGPQKSSLSLSLSSSSASSGGGTGAAGGRVGAVDWDDDRALYDRTMGCQVRAAREIKKDEVILNYPRGAMITPDLVASSDAGKAILACSRLPKSSISSEKATATANGEDTPETDFWDAFENTTICQSRFNSKLSGSNSKQLLVKILQERKRAETAFNKRLQERKESIVVEGGGKPQLLQYTIPEHGAVSTRAPLLAFLIHQRFSGEERPPVASDTDLVYEQFRHVKETSDWNALRSARPVTRPPGSPDTFAPYARTLPSSVSIPMCWKRNELALLASGIPGVVPIQETALGTMQLVSEFISLLESGVLERFPETFPDGMLTWERWVWAAAIVTSRVLPAKMYIDKGNADPSEFAPADPSEFQSPADIWSELGVMVPLLDMLNHEIDAHQVTWEPCVPEKDSPDSVEDGGGNDDSSSSQEPHGPRAIVQKKVRKGNELFTCYGDLSNSNLVSQYGFAQIINPADEVKLGWGLKDAVGHLSEPEGYTSPLKDDSSYRRFYVYETTKDEESKTWWTEDRLKVLEKELSSTSCFGILKDGHKMTAIAFSDGAYHPILLTALVVASMPKIELQKFVSSKKKNLVLSLRHQQVLRSYLAYLFSRKLEKLLMNVSSGLKDHFGSVQLWTSVSKGGLRYKPEEEGQEGSEEFIGWQSFFDAHAYKASMEVEKHYYAMGADSCVLAIYDGQLRALQVSLDGVCDDDKFKNDVLKQIQDLDFGVATEKSDGSSPGGEDAAANGGGGANDNNTASPGSDKKSPRNRKRNRNKSTVTGPAANSNSGDRPVAMKLHVGNLSFSTTPTDMYDYFCSLYGKDNILECHIPIERDTGRSRGFGFVTMPEAVAARVLESGQKHEMGGRLVKLAKSNSAGTSNSGKARQNFGSTGDRCSACGYRPKYCTCGRGGPPGPMPPGPGGPPGGRMEPGRWDDRDYSYYGGDRHRDMRYRDGPPPPPGPPPEYYDRDVERDRYGRPYERDRYSSRYDEPPPHRHPDDRYYDRDRRSRDRSRSPGRRSDRGRDYDDDRRYSSSRRGDDDYESSRDRRKRSRSRSGRSRSRSRSRSRERSRKRRSSKRRARSRSRSRSSSPPPRGNI